MGDEEEAEPAEEQPEPKKGPKSLDDPKAPPPKCWGGVPKKDSQGLIRVGLPCRTPGTARPTAIFKCMQAKKGDYSLHPQAAPPDQLNALANVDSRGPDHYPPQGGLLTKTCGVKAQFVGEIIIKKEIPPRKANCGAKTCPQEPGPNPPDPCGGASPPQIQQRPMSPTHHHQAPICALPPFPIQPEISEECRRKLNKAGPDSSRYHPDCGVVCPPPCCDDPPPCCYTPPPANCCDYRAPERHLSAGEEEKFETIRTREEILLDPCQQQCNPMIQHVAEDKCAKYVKVEDTFRRTRSLNPSPDCPPPPLIRCGNIRPCMPCIECPPRCFSPCSPPCVPCMPCSPCAPYYPCDPCYNPCYPYDPCYPCAPCQPCTPCQPCNPCYIPQCVSPCPPTCNPPRGCCESPPTCSNRYVDPQCYDAACPPEWAKESMYDPCRDGYEPYRCKPPCINEPYEPSVEPERQYMPNIEVPACNN